MNRESGKRFKITDSGDAQHPYALVDQTGTIIEIGDRPRKLSLAAFDKGADEVAHEYNLVRAAELGHV